MSTLTAETLWSIPRVGAPRALADGRILVPVVTHDPDTDERTTTLWRVDPVSGDRRPFLSGPVSGFDVDADSSALAYLQETDGRKQVHVQPLGGGEGRRVADLPRGAVGVRWMPDGRLVAMAAVLADHPTLDGTRNHAPESRLDVFATENAVYRFWDMWLEDVYHPVIIDPATGEVTDLTPGATRFWSWPNVGDTIGQLDVSPDGSLIVFSADDSEPPHRQLCFSLFSIGTDGSDLRRLDPGRDGHSTRPRFTPDGVAVVYGYRANPHFYADRLRLVRAELSGDDHVELTAGWDRSPDAWWVLDDGDVLFSAEDRGRSRLYRLPSVPGGTVAPLTDGGWTTDPSVGPDGTVYASYHSLTSPPEVYRLAPADGDADHKLDRVTHFTDEVMGDVTLGAARELTVPGADGADIQVWLIDPPEVGPQEPASLVHLLHGGPHGVFGDSWHWRWNAQVVAGAGHRVAHVNFHGSTGWGQDFTASILGAWGDLPFRDVEAVTDHLIDLGVVHADRMAVAGGSYGGYLTAWITAQTDRFACAVAHAAVTNLAGMYASDMTGGRQLAYGAEIWEDKDRIERWSPAAFPAGQSTPTLVVHGAKDERVPSTQGLEYYGVLVGKGVPARLVTFPTENHWILGRSHSIRWYREVLDWLERWMSTHDRP